MDLNDPLVLLTDNADMQQQIKSLKGLLADCHRGFQQLENRYEDLEARSLWRGQEIVRLTEELDEEKAISNRLDIVVTKLQAHIDRLDAKIKKLEAKCDV